MTETLHREPQDHPVVKAWILGAHKGAAEGVALRIECVVTMKNGKSYGMPTPPPYVRHHLEENGTVTYGDAVVPSFSSL